MRIRNIALTAAVALTSVAMLSCSGVSRETAPVLLEVAGTQTLNQIDLAPNAPNCNQSIGTVQLSVRQKNASNTGGAANLNDVRLDRYQVQYQRTDGGKLVPPGFVRSTAQLLVANAGASSLSDFVAFETNAFNQAPFAGLLPQNGGRDPDTGLGYVKMDLILTVYGETLAGDRVSGSARFPLNFCYNCGGCF
jgi:hypothetical protein